MSYVVRSIPEWAEQIRARFEVCGKFSFINMFYISFHPIPFVKN